MIGSDIELFKAADFHPAKPLVPVTNLRKDIRDLSRGDFQDVDAVIHLAALSNDPLGKLNPKLTDEINHHATLHVAQCAKQAGVSRFVFASSCSNYGRGTDSVLNEDATLNPLTEYGVSKCRAEQGLSNLADDTFKATSLRFATAYGVSPRMRFDIVLNNLAAHAVERGEILLQSDGSAWRPIIHVEDMARIMLRMLLLPFENLKSLSLNACQTSQNYQVIDLAKIVQSTVPESKIAFTSRAAPDKRSYRVSGSRLSSLLAGFTFLWSAETGAKQLYDALKQYPLSKQDFEGHRFSRITQIEKFLDQGVLGSDLKWL